MLQIAELLFAGDNQLLGALIAGSQDGFRKFAKSFQAGLGKALASAFELPSGLTGDFSALVPFDSQKLLNALAGFLGYTVSGLVQIALKAANKYPKLKPLVLPAAAIASFLLRNGTKGIDDLLRLLVGEKAQQLKADVLAAFATLQKALQTGVVGELFELVKGTVPTLIARAIQKLVPGAGVVSLILDLMDSFAETCKDLQDLLSEFLKLLKDLAQGKAESISKIGDTVNAILSGKVLPPIVKFVAILVLGSKSFKELKANIKRLAANLVKAAAAPVLKLLELILIALGKVFPDGTGGNVLVPPVTVGRVTVWVLKRKGNKSRVVMVSYNPTGEYDEVVTNPSTKIRNAKQGVDAEALQLQSAQGSGNSEAIAKETGEAVSAEEKLAAAINGASFEQIDWCAGSGFTYYKNPPGGGSWTNYIHTKYGKDATDLTLEEYKSKFGDNNLHGHHIVLKKGFESCSAPARRILCRWNINPYTGCENLAFSPNRCHSKNYAKRVLNELNKEKNKGRAAVVAKLKELAEIHRSCTDAGYVDPNTDELTQSEEAC